MSSGVPARPAITNGPGAPSFERAFGHECRYLVARRGPVVGVLPLVEIRSALFGRTLTSLPFVNFGGVLAETDEIRAGAR
jgi:hypothetical protein